MRLRIDTSGIQFRVAAMPQKRPDFTDKSTNRASEKRQAITPDGRLIWTVRLDAIDNSNETSLGSGGGCNAAVVWRVQQ